MSCIANKLTFAEIIQETNSFNPVTVDLGVFQSNRCFQGQDIFSRLDGAWGVDGVLDGLGREDGTALKHVVSAYAGAGGRIADDALFFFRDCLRHGFHGSGSGDTVFLSLHGAMASRSVDDAEGYLLQAVREEVGAAPFLVLILDHHANVTREMVAAADLVIGYETQPHDVPAAGRKAARVWRRVMAEGIRPATAWRKLPMIAPQDRFRTTAPGPMRDWFALARLREEDPRVLAVSLFPMQPWLDVEQGGWSVVVHTTGDQELAETLADELGDKAWSLRQAFWDSERVAPADAVATLDSDAAGLTVISDTGDAVLGGAPGDSTVLLGEIVRQDIGATVFLPLVDVAAVEAAHRAGTGSRVTIQVGGSADRTFYSPLKVSGVVRALAPACELATHRGRCATGRSALLETGAARLVLIDAPSLALVDPSLYLNLGLRIEDAKAVVLKTGSNFQAFARWQNRLVRADTPGMTQARLQDFAWRRLPRPIFPLDNTGDWQ